MDAAASAITIVSSVWTLTIYSKRLLEGIKNSDEKFNKLKRKVKSFTTVLESVEDIYGTDSQNVHNPAISEHQQKNRGSVCDELCACEEEFKTYEEEVSKLLSQKRTGRFGLNMAKGTWKERVVHDKLESIEQSISTHQAAIQVLIGLDHGHTLEKLLGAFSQIIAKLDDLPRLQGQTIQDDPSMSRLEDQGRRNSDLTLVNPQLEDQDTEEGTAIEIENFNSIHVFVQKFLRALLDPIPREKQSVDPSQNELWNSIMATLGGQMAPAPHLPESAAKLGVDLSPSIGLGITNAGQPHRRTSSTNSLSPLKQTITPQRLSDEFLAASAPVLTKARTYSGVSGSTLVTAVSNTSSGSGSELLVVPSSSRFQQPPQSNMSRHSDKASGRELLQATQDDLKDRFEQLIQTNASLEEKDETKERTPLMWAASKGKFKMVEMLLAEGADINAIDKTKSTALHIAIDKLQEDIIKLLLEADSATNCPDANDRIRSCVNRCDKIERTPLHVCAWLRRDEKRMLEVAKLLVEFGADVNAKDKTENYPIYYAIQGRKDSLVALLLDSGANIDFVAPPQATNDAMELLNKQRARQSPGSSSDMSQRRRDSNMTQGSRRSPRFFRRSSARSSASNG